MAKMGMDGGLRSGNGMFPWAKTDVFPLRQLMEGVGICGRAFLYYPVLLFATDILDWRSWEIIAMLGIFVSYFGRNISVRMHSKELDEL